MNDECRMSRDGVFNSALRILHSAFQSGHFPRREHRCRSGLHRPDCGGSTPPSCRGRVANFYSEVPALNRRERGAIPRQPANFNAPVAQSPERDASNVGDEGQSPSGSANSGRVSPTTRGAPLRTERFGGGTPSRGTSLRPRRWAGSVGRLRELRLGKPAFAGNHQRA
jgi:hypothetical protein